MNEEHPIGEFLKGCGIALVISLIDIASFSIGFLLLIRAMDSTWKLRYDFSLMGALGIAIIIFSVCVGGNLVDRTIHAFSDKRFYYGTGLMAFILIPPLCF